MIISGPDSSVCALHCLPIDPLTNSELRYCCGVKLIQKAYVLVSLWLWSGTGFGTYSGNAPILMIGKRLRI